MIFNEIYSAYYNAVAAILAEILNGAGGERDIEEIIRERAFSESMLTIMPYLKSGRWQLVTEDMDTPIKNVPDMPVTLLEKRWLKAISLDPRVRLFGASFDWLDGIRPLFTPDDYVIYDKYSDGDPYGDEEYVKRFRTILKAVNEKKPLEVTFAGGKEASEPATVMPLHIEYSEKDDKFRLITADGRYGAINLARIGECRIREGEARVFETRAKEHYGTAILNILDERSAMQRCMMHFAHFEKQAEKVGDRRYVLKVRYAMADETEIVIRVLGFGPLIEVAGPERLRNMVMERLKMQKRLLLR